MGSLKIEGQTSSVCIQKYAQLYENYLQYSWAANVTTEKQS